MADDFDELLNQVETQYFPLSSSKPPAKTNDSTTKTLPTNNIDAAINELLEDDDEKEVTFKRSSPPLSKVTSHQKSPRNVKKCHPVLLGGSDHLMGINEKNKKSCDRLRCMSCDFNIEWFDDRKWKASVQYLFFRNNFPDRHKLNTNTVHSSGSRAYCCQCSWRSVTCTVQLSDDPSLKWTCQKHDSL